MKIVSWALNIFIKINLFQLFCAIYLIFNKTNFTHGSNHEKSQNDHPGHNQKFGSHGPFLKFEEVKDEISTKNFFNNYVKTKKPLIMRNLLKNDQTATFWTDKYLLEKSLGYEQYKLSIETVKKESRSQEIIELSFKDFLQNYKQKEVYMVNEVPFFLKNDVILPQPLQCEHAPKSLEQTMMWFSSGATSSVTHTDDYENILWYNLGQ